MQIRLLVLDRHKRPETDGLHYGIVEQNMYRPAKLQVSEDFDRETGEYVNWQDVTVTFESEEF